MADDLRIGQGWDIHRLVPGRRLVLGGVEIPFARGLLGHSDADVLLHAIVDALLGAIADADIGTHFSDTDPEWRDVASSRLLAGAAERARGAGWTIANIDATVVLEDPRIGPHRERMRAAIAAAAGVAVESVSVKAKTAEGLGVEGRGEAISAQAVVLVRRRGG
ncbi:MAG: 2-C-methyl-D-erythritol 2,4-cyclodiphosphate synthase [Candidatus Eisenbacteria bacterium]|uniref:2-C-methyl-D-erythritol 2,4-cyclodiphosphate synthase n=1 Tax=Eiseniibacteriota bacterium TaxID=2212470 RepID=A0A937X9V1_UNCEI|nr:2-C-methyl-D-erythritol 2,4-cyclodiphosphate synthase [Candidatus Eisenbacteria bacterium]